MDPDMVMEVPDTPDRVCFRRPVGESSSSYSSQRRNSGLHDCNVNGATPLEGDFLFSQAKLARLIPDSSNIITANSKMIDLSQESPSPLSYNVKCGVPRHKEEKHASSQMEDNQSAGYGKLGARSVEVADGLTKGMKNGNFLKAVVSSNGRNEDDNLKCHGKMVPNGKEKAFVQPLNSQFRNDHIKSKAYNQELRNLPKQGSFSSLFVKNHDNKMEKGSCNVSQYANKQANHRHEELALHPKNMGHRRLVRNGCISPSNIAIHKNNVTDKGNEEGNFISTHSSNIEGRITDKGKGKEIINDEPLASSRHIESNSQIKRSLMSQKQEPLLVSDVDYDGRRIQNAEYGTTHKHVGNPSPFFHVARMSENEDAACHLSTYRDDDNNGGTKYTHSLPEKHKKATFQSIQDDTRDLECFQLDCATHHTGKRKDRFAHFNAGECSSSTFDRMRRPLNDRMSAKPSYTRLTRSRKSERDYTAAVPIFDIDEQDSSTQEENHELCDESFAKSIQLESDEVLARRLQEQFYLESPPVGDAGEQFFLESPVGAAEVDSALEFPWLLEEDDRQVFNRMQGQLRQEEALRRALLGRSRFRHSSARMTSRARAENRLDRAWRNISRRSMSLEERLDLLEAIEAAIENGDMDAPDNFSGVQNNFNGNAYEMLLALDENNHYVGATERQINSLPQSLIQNSGSEEACTICLEAPSVGDTIRHLPCLHKFHKTCIDTWLRKKRSCPICKSSIA